VRFLQPLLLTAALALPCAAGAADPAAAVASNLTRPLTEIAARFREDSGIRVRLTFGSSGNFTSQVRQGAPYSLFISADARHVEILRREGFTVGEPVTLAFARIGVFVPAGSPLHAAPGLKAVMHALQYGRFRRIAMANPEHAPFGAAAMQALVRGGVWALERDRVVYGESVAQAVQFTLAGGVDAGFIPLSFALQPNIASRGRFFLLPEDWHDPLEQRMTLLRNAGPEAQKFFRYLQSAAAREILEQHGYRVVAAVPAGAG
jgi:molybdate transport system substrate-binding protein